MKIQIECFLQEHHYTYDCVLDWWQHGNHPYKTPIRIDWATLEYYHVSPGYGFDRKHCMSFLFDKTENTEILKALGFVCTIANDFILILDDYTIHPRAYAPAYTTKAVYGYDIETKSVRYKDLIEEGFPKC